ncbi:hypothetical protein K431DRAFT_42426 [Polychaeton citri CBS 116435]|uniref:Uncharacterized protein n=1 Tax=Polychaeton citri CBS 116435 TaxID=1314669 RepID=A0A9P4URB1_9PEZI|nr:hypothetical protein K431DRAFT_42426 [Polychaeton citri CBS 116435]
MYCLRVRSVYPSAHAALHAWGFAVGHALRPPRGTRTCSWYLLLMVTVDAHTGSFCGRVSQAFEVITTTEKRDDSSGSVLKLAHIGH